MTTIYWPAQCMKPRHPEIGEDEDCKREVYMAIITKDGSSPSMFFCREHGLEFMAVLSLEYQKDILTGALKG